MSDIHEVQADQRTNGGDRDSGSTVGWAIGVLGAILLGLVVFVGWKYVFANDEDEAGSGPVAEPSTIVYVTASAGPSPSEEPPPSPTPTAGMFDGTWTGYVTGDWHTYDIEVVIVDDGVELTGDVTYTWNPPRPGVDNCEGEWTQIASHNKHADVNEIITSGPCWPEVDITLDLKPNGTIAFAVFYSDEYHPKATLTRED
jgi:hypothetical protein